LQVYPFFFNANNRYLHSKQLLKYFGKTGVDAIAFLTINRVDIATHWQIYMPTVTPIVDR